MCGRFCIAASPGDIMERYQVQVPYEYTAHYNVSPSNKILAITKGIETYEAGMYEWGIKVNSPQRIINARIETVHDKPLFKMAFEKHRCLIPASGYYEWKHDENKKTPHYFTSQTHSIISFAGLIRSSSEGDQVVIITTQATLPYAEIHDRMPVILDPRVEKEFLTDGIISIIEKPLDSYEVSPRVNQVGVNDPDLFKPWKARSKQLTLGDI